MASTWLKAIVASFQSENHLDSMMLTLLISSNENLQMLQKKGVTFSEAISNWQTN